MKRRESKTLFNPVFINPQQVDHFLICRVGIAVYRLPKRPFCYIYVKVMTDERSYQRKGSRRELAVQTSVNDRGLCIIVCGWSSHWPDLKIMVDNHVKSHNDWSNIKLMTSKG